MAVWIFIYGLTNVSVEEVTWEMQLFNKYYFTQFLTLFTFVTFESESLYWAAFSTHIFKINVWQN